MEKLKKCSTCGEIKEIKHFNKNRSNFDGFCYLCKICSSEANKRYRKNNPDKAKDSRKKWVKNNPDLANIIRKTDRLRRDHKITYEEFHSLLVDQNGCCAICLEQLIFPQVDHDHSSGIIRGLLCKRCNMALGLLKDNIKTMKNAISYLEEERRMAD